MNSTNKNPTQLPDYWQKNIELLKLYRNDIYQKIIQYEPKEDLGKVIPTETVPTIELTKTNNETMLLYNKKDPWQDVVGHLSIIESNAKYNHKCIFIGLGLGYGPLLVLRECKNLIKIIIFEPNIELFICALKLIDLSELILSGKVNLIIGKPNWELFVSILDYRFGLDKTYSLTFQPFFDWKPDLYQTLNEEVAKQVNTISWGTATAYSSSKIIMENSFKNLTLIKHTYSIDSIKDLFKNKPAILISPGPSLSQTLPLLKNTVDKCILIATDSALKPLIEANICPDFVTTASLKQLTFEKFKPLIGKNLPFSLIASTSSTPRMLKHLYPKNIFFSFTEITEELKSIQKSLGIKSLLKPFSNVANLSLSTAIHIGADPIIFIGQDLAPASTNSGDVTLYSKGAIFEISNAKNNNYKQLLKSPNIIFTKSIHGDDIPTFSHFMQFKTEIENIIASEPRTYINATAFGADIKGTKVIHLNDVINKHLTQNFLPSDIIQHVLNSSNTINTEQLITALNQLLTKVNEKLVQIGNSRKKIIEVLILLKKSKKQIKNANNFDNLPQKIQEPIAEMEKIRSKVVMMKELNGIFYKKGTEIERLYKKIYLKHGNNYIKRVKKISISFELYKHKCQIETINAFKSFISNLLDYLIEEKKLLNISNSKNKNFDNLLALSELYIESYNFALAKEILNKFSKEHQQSAEFNYQMGAVKAGLLNYEKAHNYWEEAKKIDCKIEDKINKQIKNEAQFWFNYYENGSRGLGYFLDKTWQKRILSLVKDQKWIIKKYNDIWQKYLSKNNLENIRNQWLESFENIEKKLLENNSSININADVRDKIVFNFIATWYLRKANNLIAAKEYNEAVSSLNYVITMEPDNDVAIFLLAKALIENNMFEDGFGYLQKAVKLNPNNAILWDQVGDNLFEAQDYLSAAMAYEHCYNALPEKIEVLNKLGDCFWIAKDFNKAKIVYELLIKKDPKNFLAKIRLDEIEDLI